MILGNQPTLNQNSGDKINEINFAKNLSKYFDVYYNNQKFDPNNIPANIEKSIFASIFTILEIIPLFLV